MVKKINKNTIINENVLAEQMSQFDYVQPENTEVSNVQSDDAQNTSIIGSKLDLFNSGKETTDVNFSRKLGESISAQNYANGWFNINRELLGERSLFYPEDWTFMVRPATVEAIRNWSMIDETNGSSIDDVFNEILKYCLSIKTSTGANIPVFSINSWDRFFFVLLIREYTFIKGESKIEYYEDCPNCGNQIKYTLNSQALMYDMPDESVLKYYDRENRVWHINPAEFEIPNYDELTLYVPTVDRDAAIKQWMINEYQENEKKKFDPVFIKMLPWLAPKISKDPNIAKQQIKKIELEFRMWDKEMFSFVDEVIRNITVTPMLTLSEICSNCGEEATSKIRFPKGISSLFNVVNRHTKFGSK